jgi:hypothetical protein
MEYFDLANHCPPASFRSTTTSLPRTHVFMRRNTYGVDKRTRLELTSVCRYLRNESRKQRRTTNTARTSPSAGNDCYTARIFPSGQIDLQTTSPYESSTSLVASCYFPCSLWRTCILILYVWPYREIFMSRTSCVSVREENLSTPVWWKSNLGGLESTC